MSELRYIRPGTPVMQDMALKYWPIGGADVNTLFEVVPFSATRVGLRARGFGDKDDYGNGRLYCGKRALRKTPVRR